MDILLSGTLALGEQRSGYIGAHNTRSKYRRCSTAFKQDIHPAGLSLPVRVDELGEGGTPLALPSPSGFRTKGRERSRLNRLSVTVGNAPLFYAQI